MVGFDWYQATVPAPVNDVLEVLAGLGTGLQLSHDRGMHGYASTAVLGSESDGPAARVMHGGSHEYPHAVVSGDWAQPGAELIRAAFPEHSVSRLDVREDFSDDGAFDAIQAQLVNAAIQHRLKVGTAGDHLVTLKGRTVYLGAPSSAVRLRLYDKRAEILSKYVTEGDRATVVKALRIPDSLARLEAQIRPQGKAAKVRFSTMEPTAALGCTRWMRQVWHDVAGLELTPCQVGKPWRQSDLERAYKIAMAQYGGVFRRMYADLGSWECVGLQIGHDLARQ